MNKSSFPKSSNQLEPVLWQEANIIGKKRNGLNEDLRKLHLFLQIIIALVRLIAKFRKSGFVPFDWNIWLYLLGGLSVLFVGNVCPLLSRLL